MKPTEDIELVAALQRGEEAAFLELIDRYHACLIRATQLYVPSQAVAEEVAQEAWIGVLAGIGRFEGRSSLKSWIFRIAINCAKARGPRERRSVPFSSMAPVEGADEPAVDPERFRGEDHRWAGHWASPPERWGEARLLEIETADVARRAIEALASEQRQVITLRDVEEWSAEEVCEALGISESNQRVLLHRARCKVRSAIEAYMQSAELLP